MVVSFDTAAGAGGRPRSTTRKVSRRPSADCVPAAAPRFTTPFIFACKDKLQQRSAVHKFRRAIVMLSDGDDNNSRYTRDQALEMAQKADVGHLRDLHQPHARSKRMATRC